MITLFGTLRDIKIMVEPHNIPKSQLLLYADDGYDSHVTRFLLAEKKLEYHCSYLESERPEDLATLNPYQTLPILTHADIVLYEINVIFEYLEERYHHHKLLPDSPQRRAQVRQLAWRIQKDWLVLARQLLLHPDSFDAKTAKMAKKQLSDSLVTLAPLFTHKSYFLSDEFGWCDVLLTPLLWRLKKMRLSLPMHLIKPLIDYQNRMFERVGFQESLRFTDN